MSAQVQPLRKVEARTQEEIRSILARAQAGDEEAFHVIFHRFSRPILSFISHMLSDRDRAEELMQETFVRAYRNLGSMRRETELSAWLFGIARNVVREAVKEKYKEQGRVGFDQVRHDGMDLADAGPPLDERLMTAQLENAIHRALASLSSDHRVVFVLKIFNEKSYQEIAQITGSSVAKLKTDLHRARLEMRRRLHPYLGETPGLPSR